jgi:hypothetical protein
MCGGGQTCLNGECGLNCTVGTSTVASGSLNPGNPCQLCEPGLTTTAWSGAVDGTSCAPGGACTSAVCTPGCYVAGTFYSAGPNPGNACQLCTPSTSTTAWTDVANGTSTPCPVGELCNAGSCASGCYIAGIFYASGALDPGNACLECHPPTSTKLWHAEPNGTACGAGDVCTNGVCGPSGSGSSDAGSGGGSGTGTGTP